MDSMESFPEEISAALPPLAENSSQATWMDKGTTDDDGEEEAFRDTDEESPVSADELSKSDSHLIWEGSTTAASGRSHQRRSYAERVRMFKLRRNLHQLHSLYRQKQHEVQIAREVQKETQMHIAELEAQREKVEKEMEQRKGGDKAVSLLPLTSQHQRLCAELQAEEALKTHISQTLREREVQLYQAEVDLGRCSHLRKKVQQEVQDWETEQGQKVAQRLQKEKDIVQKTQIKMRKERRRLGAVMQEQEASRRKAAEEVRASRERASVHFKETVKRIRQAKAAEELEGQERTAKRMQAILSLKSSIAAIQENLLVKQARDQDYALKQKEEERQLIERLQAEGSDVTKFLFQQKHIMDFQRKKEEFEKKQRSRRVEIIAKLLQEEALAEKTKTRSTLFFPPTPPTTAKAPGLSNSRGKLLQSTDPASAQPEVDTVERRTRSLTSSEESVSSSGNSVGRPKTDDEEEEAEWAVEGRLAQPEFAGLWDRTHGEPQVRQDEGGTSEHFHLSKMEHKELVPVPRNHQRVMARKKLPSGKDFKGCPFVSKPKSISFKDFDVGKIYKKKILLTNVTYHTNYCKLLGVSEELRDFISICFEPPGPLSPGMACALLTIFTPMVNKDLDGEIQFTSAAGPFAIPLKCTTKKCVLAVDHTSIDFGAHVIGETVSRTITLTNQGGLGTRFVLASSTQPKPPHHPYPNPHTAPSSKDRQETTNVRLEGDGLDPQELRGVKGQEEIADMCRGAQDPPNGPSTKVSSLEGGGADPLESSKEDNSQGGEIRAGKVTEGEIIPFGCVKLEILFTPTLAGEAEMDFNISFSDPNSPPISITAKGVAVDVPVWVTQPNVDLKICMYDRLYQDCIIVHSRASTALRLSFTVCKELRSHMEILPKTGFLQAHSTFQAQLRFLPRSSLPKDALKFFDSETGVLEALVAIQVAGQVRPIPLTVHAVVTTSDLEFDRTDVDFGLCTIFESVKSSVRLTNHSLLPQDFGFLGIPKFIDVQPSDGFGTLLPLETMEIDIIFSPEKVGEYSFQLTCKSGINRDFKLSCQAAAVRPPLELSRSLVKFSSTAVGDHSTALLYVVNPQEAPQGRPWLFQFVLPEHSEISISPTAGWVLPGQRCLIQVTFRPRLSEEQVRREVLRPLEAEPADPVAGTTQCAEEAASVSHAPDERKVASEAVGGRLRGSGGPPQSHTPLQDRKETQVSAEGVSISPAGGPVGKAVTMEKSGKVSWTPKVCSPNQPPKPEDIQEGSEEYAAGKASLLRSYPRRFSRYIVPCFVTSDSHMGCVQEEGLPYSPHHTLYLELHCAAERPCMVVSSNNGQTTLNFNQVATGQKVVQRVTLENISQKTLELRSSLLDVCGPFVILNALRPLEPRALHTILLGFTPSQARKYFETVEIRCAEMGLQLALYGVGVEPEVTCLHEGKVMNFGYVLEGENTSQVFTLRNTSSFLVKFCVHLDSLSQTKRQGLPEFLTPGSHPVVGTQNYSGLCVFTVSPVGGSIPPGKTQDITVTFQPDHESPFYSDRLSVELMSKQTVCSLDLKGGCCRYAMFLCGGDPLSIPTESLANLPPREHTSLQVSSGRSAQLVLLTFEATHSGDGLVPVARQLTVGCVHSSQKSVEFRWDGLPTIQQTGFTVEPPSGVVEPGVCRAITVTWAPPNGLEFYRVVHATAQLSLRADHTEVYSVNLLATVV